MMEKRAQTREEEFNKKEENWKKQVQQLQNHQAHLLSRLEKYEQTQGQKSLPSSSSTSSSSSSLPSAQIQESSSTLHLAFQTVKIVVPIGLTAALAWTLYQKYRKK